MEARWFEGHILAEVVLGNWAMAVPIQVIFTNNGVMSVTVGNENFAPNAQDLDEVATWAQGVAKAMGVPDEQVFVGSYRGKISK